jgi:hypothetical protein
MGFWNRLLSGARPPAGELAGDLRNGRKHGVWVEKENASLVERTY